MEIDPEEEWITYIDLAAHIFHRCGVIGLLGRNNLQRTAAYRHDPLAVHTFSGMPCHMHCILRIQDCTDIAYLIMKQLCI